MFSNFPPKNTFKGKTSKFWGAFVLLELQEAVALQIWKSEDTRAKRERWGNEREKTKNARKCEKHDGKLAKRGKNGERSRVKNGERSGQRSGERRGEGRKEAGRSGQISGQRSGQKSGGRKRGEETATKKVKKNCSQNPRKCAKNKMRWKFKIICFCPKSSPLFKRRKDAQLVAQMEPKTQKGHPKLKSRKSAPPDDSAQKKISCANNRQGLEKHCKHTPQNIKHVSTCEMTKKIKSGQGLTHEPQNPDVSSYQNPECRFVARGRFSKNEMNETQKMSPNSMFSRHHLALRRWN